MRNALHRTLRADTFDEQQARAALCIEHANYNATRDIHRQQLAAGQNGNDENTLEAALRYAGFPPIDPVHLGVPEEEYVMSYMLTQIEMEQLLKTDWDSITEATKMMAVEFQQEIKKFEDTKKKVSVKPKHHNVQI